MLLNLDINAKKKIDFRSDIKQACVCVCLYFISYFIYNFLVRLIVCFLAAFNVNSDHF